MAMKENITVLSSPLSRGRIPSLDGFRALSIMLVLLEHLCGTVGFPQDNIIFKYLGDFGNLGVRIFFVISGFLITSLLLEESERNGQISLRSFYFRRILRIFPAAYSFIAAIWVASAIGLLNVGVADFVSACTYTMNYLHPRNWNLAHLWSLSIEEQFYILWPFALCLAGKRRAMMIAVFVLILSPCVRIASDRSMCNSVLLEPVSGSD
jgi:peptidoglycan/LPS O-acetylase OafA/YrhL